MWVREVIWLIGLYGTSGELITRCRKWMVRRSQMEKEETLREGM